MTNQQTENVIIIGSGPAGYTAAIYAARANLKPVVFEGLQAGGIPGGQLMTTTEVENFPGFPEGITGPQLMSRMKAQAERWGTECYTEDVIEVDLSQRPFTVRSDERELKTNSIIIATGATAKKLGLPSEKTYWSNGISACAICDGASPIFIDQELVVIGGGDSAAEEAVYLTKYGSHVNLLVRREEMRASKAMQDRVLGNPKVTVHWNTEAVDVFGENNLMTGIRVRNTKTGEETEIAAKGLFYAIGHNPNTSLFKGQLELDPVGYILVKPRTVETSVEGVYAAGDVQDHEYRQAISAAGTGCMAALSAERWLSEHNLILEHHQALSSAAKETEEKVNQGATKADTETDFALNATRHYGGYAPKKLSPQSERLLIERWLLEHNLSRETDRALSSAAKEREEEVNQVDTEADFALNATRHYGGYALRKLFHESDRLLIVKYVSPTCSLSKTLTPILNKVVDEYEGKIHSIEIDITEDLEIAKIAQITGTPTIQFFLDQEMLQEMKGVKPKSEFRLVIENYLSIPLTNSSERSLSEDNLSREHHQAVSSAAPERQEAVNQVETKADTETDFDLNTTRHYGGYALRKLFHESDRLLIVKYVSPTCGPCRTLTPILNKVVDEYEDKIHLVEIDITEDLEIAKMGQVTGTPTIQFFLDQEMLQEMKGVKQKSELRRAIENYLPMALTNN